MVVCVLMGSPRAARAACARFVTVRDDHAAADSSRDVSQTTGPVAFHPSKRHRVSPSGSSVFFRLNPSVFRTIESRCRSPVDGPGLSALIPPWRVLHTERIATTLRV